MFYWDYTIRENTVERQHKNKISCIQQLLVIMKARQITVQLAYGQYKSNGKQKAFH